ncbi:LOW QUALITY PROTEIN: sodium/potassium/calcium exchanger 3-like [Pomacea canaliculata]|uniref:LOW QUALITY PROTEIN: sodium/potassium/calcium exchanger 3-like n=1 Tax=Pomacea canaliculata TaxID=400727 RepID=UPI000D735A5C|nr:LOW QUALITY PROTEIN: sodium/potassium/calcium exchanger 3-like [Pomacea canaliculata]
MERGDHVTSFPDKRINDLNERKSSVIHADPGIDGGLCEPRVAARTAGGESESWTQTSIKTNAASTVDPTVERVGDVLEVWEGRTPGERSWEDDSGNCTPRAVNNFPENFFSLELTKDGAVVLHILIAFYLFAALAIICDDYFVPSLEQICKDLHLKEDVAGATFMAAGSSAPELCTSIVGLFIARSDVGVGTIVGSAVFNILFIIGICGLFAGMVVQLTWYPLVRDTLFYLASVVALVLCIEDSKIHWYEALIMLLMYCVYIVIMYFNAGMERFFIALWERLWSGRKPADEEVDDVEARQPLLKSQDKTGSQPLLQSDNVSSGDDVIGRPNKVDSDVSIRSDKVSDDHVSSEGRQLPSRDVGTQEEETSLTESVKAASTGQDSSSGSDEASVWEIPEPFLVRVLWVAMVPMKGLFYLTVPDCRQERMRRLYPVTFVMSVVWIAASSYVLVWMITIAGDALQVPDTVMGLTLLAAGTSLPDCLASLFVARDGFGDMAVSNSIGSNVFDILICLGLPWLIETAAVNSGDDVTQFNSSGRCYSSLTLLATSHSLLRRNIHQQMWA